jgi:hypothetical protein
MIEFRKNNDVLGTVNRGNPCELGLCTLCRADCAGKVKPGFQDYVVEKCFIREILVL